MFLDDYDRDFYADLTQGLVAAIRGAAAPRRRRLTDPYAGYFDEGRHMSMRVPWQDVIPCHWRRRGNRRFLGNSLSGFWVCCRQQDSLWAGQF